MADVQLLSTALLYASEAVHILHSNVITDADLDFAKELLEQFYMLYSDLYG